MMVASSTLVNLEQPHQRYFSSDADASSHDMDYHIPQMTDSKGYVPSSVFSAPPGSFSAISNPSLSVPNSDGYKDVFDCLSARKNDSGMYTSPTRTDPFFTEPQSEDSGSPKEKKFAIPVNQTFPVTHEGPTGNRYEHSRLTPTEFSPPAKRVLSGSPSIVQNTNMMNDPRTIQMNHNGKFIKKRFPSMDGNYEEPQNVSGHSYNPHTVLPETSNFSLNDFKNSSSPPGYKKSTTSASPSMIIDENSVRASPTNVRHPSQSSTHSSSSSTSKPTTPSRTLSAAKTPTGLKTAPNFFFDDDDDDSWKICAVCNDKATGYHFNALTCEGCKGFFRRSMKNSKTFTCPYSGNCTITKNNRRQCQACRLEKCLRIGMKKECIMSSDQILLKKNLMLNNKIKRNLLEWKPIEMTEEKKELLDIIRNAFCDTNKLPPVQPLNEISVHENSMGNPCTSPASTSSGHSGFSDLINRMTQDIIATAPTQEGASQAHMRHFSSIMEFSIKEIIKFCKKIPSFTSISLKDQITLLKSGCTEILFIKANYTYDKEQNALMCGPGKYYTRKSFILAGMSEEYTDCYLKFHYDLSHMQLTDTEMACLCAATLFSSDRDELESRDLVEEQQERIANSLQAYTENTHHCRLRFPKILSYLSRLRTLNWHISQTLKRIQDTAMTQNLDPLVLEVAPTI